ncbi:magnesium chelatase subunit D [uncultured Tateyamaria sp.]|uniref:magnesium chelatase subunit D n=1 Tax=Tateyamaria sp. 1078 TaxID=3417464 RepID=UPI00261D0674|nr:magnesium chelatase subunit D [uncultured Tateyamaria sp.]
MSDTSWHLAAAALDILAVDPQGLGGAVLKMRAGPDRDRLVAAFAPPAPLRKLPITIADEQLLGGVDLAATLAAGKIVRSSGFFATPCTAVLPMAERCAPALAAKLCQLTDQGLTQGILALDEGIEVDEALPDSLSDRLAFHIAPEGRMPRDWPARPPTPPGAPVDADEAMAQLTLLAARFGIASLRAPLLAWRAAQAHAASQGRTGVRADDIELAAALVYPHRALHMPETDAPTEQPPAPEDQVQQDDGTQDGQSALPDTEMLIDAVAALLPAGLLQTLGQARSARAAKGSGAGKVRKSNRRGRPLPSRPGRLGGDARIDLIATLRAAAPWQPLRRTHQPDREGLLIHPSDIRTKRYAQHSDRLLIFSVDASGSAAMARLGEAKGAIELLLAEAYASRDHVALISFRGTQAETLLPPTRSLVQTKRRLSALPGGGGTPLAAGLHSAMTLAAQSAGQGMTPTIIVLTDGRANIALDGSAHRATAAEDAQTVARAIRAQGTDALVIDMSNRPQPALQDLGRTLDGSYIALPRADAHRMTDAVSAALAG